MKRVPNVSLKRDKFSEHQARWMAVLAVCCLFVAVALFGSGVSAASNQERPRSTQPAVPASSPSPTPAQRPVDRVAPTLGEPPPVPRLKPTPTPTPPEVLDPDSIVRVNTDLVQLHVRVIDRNNRPINDVPQNAFRVFEDGAPQPIENFSREEVPISYGLAVDTSGSLRSQLQSVIDAGKSIINANKPGDETFLVRFISSDKIETVQDFTANKEMLKIGRAH